MSEELQWELYDIFASGIFAFPVYEHSSARRIVRYLLMRGVPDEDVAQAIEGHTLDLRLWLGRTGKRMVGEWVIAWLNERREDYKYEMHRERSRGSVGGKSPGSNSGYQSERRHKRRRHKQRGNSPGMLDFSDDSDDDFFDDDDGDDCSDLSSFDTASYEGSATSLGSINTSVASYKKKPNNNFRNKPNSTDTVSNLQRVDNTTCRAVRSENEIKCVAGINERKDDAHHSDSACWLNTDTNSELDGHSAENVTRYPGVSTIDIVNLVERKRNVDDSLISQNCDDSVVNKENIDQSQIQRKTTSPFCRVSSNFFGFIPHNSTSTEFAGHTTNAQKKRPHSAQTPSSRIMDNSSECQCSFNDSASSILGGISPARSDQSSAIYYNTRSWFQRSPGDSPQSLPLHSSNTVADGPITKKCRCTLPHYTRKNSRNILICDSPSHCQLCRNSRPLEELQTVAVATKRRKGSSCMFWKVPWIA